MAFLSFFLFWVQLFDRVISLIFLSCPSLGRLFRSVKFDR